MVVKGTLKNGFDYEFDDKVFHSWDFLKAVRDSQKSDTSYAFVDMVELMLGEAQEDKLIAYLKDKGEDVTIELMGDIVKEITDAVSDDTKNL